MRECNCCVVFIGGSHPFQGSFQAIHLYGSFSFVTVLFEARQLDLFRRDTPSPRGLWAIGAVALRDDRCADTAAHHARVRLHAVVFAVALRALRAGVHRRLSASARSLQLAPRTHVRFTPLQHTVSYPWSAPTVPVVRRMPSGGGATACWQPGLTPELRSAALLVITFTPTSSQAPCTEPLRPGNDMWSFHDRVIDTVQCKRMELAERIS